jgi:hypothetical protein
MIRIAPLTFGHEPRRRAFAHSGSAMLRSVTTLVILILFAGGAILRADGGSTAAPRNGNFRPVWTAIGAGAGFGLGVWAGLTHFDDAVNSDRKVWTTAIVSAAAGGVLGFLVDRRRARGPANPSATVTALRPGEWRRHIYGSPSAQVTLVPPSVATVTRLNGQSR